MSEIDVAAGVWLGISEDDPVPHAAAPPHRPHERLLSTDALAPAASTPPSSSVQSRWTGAEEEAVAAVTPG